MDTLATAPTAFNLREPIPGYLLRERIGAGGYGEVWLADAPGGLTKAVKIVYGPLQDGRAERELKALNRIKLVQHPLLLTLERIEMINEHLIIVMELAHGSLKERFDKHCAEGERGIPRTELLAYLRDVADALDFLYEEHCLQHLDVKPENLLLIANRVKVADFGLIKDLGDRSASLVGGLTPLYAPPEVFDGRPNRNSDQYSLAMVYQELLTGEPAFAGRTAAQLAAQHLHSSPCLAPLPTTDQPVIARALSKDPDRRFPSCRALIDSLTEAPKATSRVRRPVPESSRITPLTRAATETTSLVGARCADVAYPVPSAVRNLGALEISQEAAPCCRPAVFIGVGGTGASVLRSLRARLGERFGNVDAIPSLQMLLLDTDSNALNDATRGDRSSALRPVQLVLISLRSPQAYRGDAKTFLEWLNRRWLFNIPRTLTTEGIRPLGRLAFVDHFEKIANVLHHALSSVVANASLESSSRATGLRFVKEAPRIFVVASTAGGVGSGLVLDLGYLIRTILEELHVSDEQLHGMLVHATSRRTNQRDLALANSLSLLTELHHYTSESGYPGEPACKLPPRVDNNAPFRHTYVTHLGDELSEDEFAKGTSVLGEYLYQNTVSAAAAFFDQCRGDGDAPYRLMQTDAAVSETVQSQLATNATMRLFGQGPISPEHSDSVVRARLAQGDTVRSFGIAQVGAPDVALVREAADALCETLISRWAGRQPSLQTTQVEPNTIDPEIASVASKFANGMGLRFDKLITWSHHLLEQQLGDTPEAYFQRRITEALEHATSSEPRARLRLATKVVRNELYGADPGDDSIQSRICDLVASAAVTKRQMLREWFFILLDAPKARVAGTRESMRWYLETLDELELQVTHTLAQLDVSKVVSTAEAVRDVVFRDTMTQLQHISLQAVLQLVRELQAEVRQCEDLLHEFARRLLHLAREFAVRPQSTLSADNPHARIMKDRHLELTKQLERELAPTLVHQHLALSDLLTVNTDAWTSLVAIMRNAAQRLSRNAISRLEVSSVLHGTGQVNAAECIRAALPRLRECGGDGRFLLVAPQNTDTWPEHWKQAFEAAAGASSSLVTGSDESLVVCYETERVPLRNVAARLIAARSDLVKVADRLHTRIDVEWPSLESWLSNQD